MKFNDCLERFIRDKRFGSKSSERHYRDCLVLHGEDCDWRDPRQTTRRDVKKTLERWPHPNTARNKKSILSSFYSWTVMEGLRRDNPVHGVQPIRARDPEIRRLTHDEAVLLLGACKTRRERWTIYLGACAGLRSAELRGLRGKHFKRPGFIWVASEFAKGHKERWVPIVSELEPIVAEIQEQIEPDNYVLPAQRKAKPGSTDRAMFDQPTKQASAQSLWRLVVRAGERVGVEVNVHALRHVYADHMVRHASLHHAQAMMGHRDISTTKGYLSKPSLDELAAAVQGFSLGGPGGSDETEPENPLVARRGFEPLLAAVKAGEPEAPLIVSILELLERDVDLYVNHFGELEAA